MTSFNGFDFCVFAGAFVALLAGLLIGTHSFNSKLNAALAPIPLALWTGYVLCPWLEKTPVEAFLSTLLPSPRVESLLFWGGSLFAYLLLLLASLLLTHVLLKAVKGHSGQSHFWGGLIGLSLYALAFLGFLASLEFAPYPESFLNALDPSLEESVVIQALSRALAILLA
jgi:hypothetical protein